MAAFSALDKKAQALAARPKQLRYIVGDTTPEALQEVLKDSHDGVLSVQDELSGWFGAFDKFSPGKAGQADKGMYLQAYSGGTYNLNRVGRGVIQIPNLSVGIVGGIQPAPLRAIASDLTDDGLLQRFIPVILKQTGVGHDEPAGDAPAAYKQLIERLARMTSPEVSGNLSGGQPIMFSAQARTVRERLEIEHDQLARSLESVSAKFGSHVGKYHGIFARLCLIWHCIESEGTIASAEISGELAERVARFMRDFIQPSGRAFYVDTLGVSPDHDKMMSLANLIVAKSLSEVTSHDVQKSTQSLRGISADELRALCEKLESLGWLNRADPGPKSKTPKWMVNTAVHELFAERGIIERDRRAVAKKAISEALAV
jgi:hypothetical protein